MSAALLAAFAALAPLQACSASFAPGATAQLQVQEPLLRIFDRGEQGRLLEILVR